MKQKKQPKKNLKQYWVYPAAFAAALLIYSLGAMSRDDRGACYAETIQQCDQASGFDKALCAMGTGLACSGYNFEMNNSEP